MLMNRYAETLTLLGELPSTTIVDILHDMYASVMRLRPIVLQLINNKSWVRHIVYSSMIIW